MQIHKFAKFESVIRHDAIKWERKGEIVSNDSQDEHLLRLIIQRTVCTA